jgi:putative copper export protein/mono/diheme cytochrome c family protein
MTGAELLHGLVRGTHVAATLSIFGSMLFHAVIAGSAAGPISDATRGLNRRLVALAWYSLAVAVVAAVVWLPLEAAAVAGDGGIDQVLATIPIVLWRSRFGTLLLWRLGLLVAACLCFGRTGRQWQWLATLLSGLALALQVGLGHGLSMGGDLGLTLLCAEAVHLLAAGAWLGGLLPLFLMTGLLPLDLARPAIQRFSRLGLLCVLFLAATIVIQSWVLIGSVPGLIGTDYGWLAVLKAAIFMVLLGLAALNRWRFVPRLDSGSRADAKRALRLSIAVEVLFGLLVVLAAGLLLTQPPAIHQQPHWPFAWQLSLAAWQDQDLRSEVLLGAGQAMAGVLLLVGVVFLRRLRWPALAGAAVVFWWSTAHLDLLLVPAYPTSFYQSPTGFTAAAIANGATLFQANCTGCHGMEGRGDGPKAKDLVIKPADLTAEHLFAHADGELFWWLSHGIEGPQGDLVMPGFAGQLDDNERWDLIDYIRAHNAGLALRASGQFPQPMQAPDVTVTIKGRQSVLSQHRGQIVVLAAAGNDMAASPALPQPSPPVALSNLEPDSDAWRAYAIIAGVTPDQLAGTEFLVDADGWLRATFRPMTAGAWPDPAGIVAAAEVVAAEPIARPASGMHHHH